MGVDFDYFSKFLLTYCVMGFVAVLAQVTACFPSRRPENVAEYRSVLC